MAHCRRDERAWQRQHASPWGRIHGLITIGRAIDEANTAVALCAAALRRALA